MRTPAFRRVAFVVAFPVLAGAVPGCFLGISCTAVGCGTTATLKLTVPTTTSSVFPLAVTTCRNADCRMAEVAMPPVGGGNLSFVSFPELPAATPGTAATSTTASLMLREAGGHALEIRWDVQDEALIANGDVYKAAVADAKGAALATLDKTARYEKFYPNGEDCDSGCKVVTLEMNP